jgi:hypothetical protein
MTDPIRIVVSLHAGSAVAAFDGFLGGERLCTSTEPFLAAARELLKRGVDPSCPLEMWHPGQTSWALRSTVRTAAAMTVSEHHHAPRFVKYRPFRGN